MSLIRYKSFRIFGRFGSSRMDIVPLLAPVALLLTSQTHSVGQTSQNTLIVFYKHYGDSLIKDLERVTPPSK